MRRQARARQADFRPFPKVSPAGRRLSGFPDVQPALNRAGGRPARRRGSEAPLVLSQVSVSNF